MMMVTTTRTTTEMTSDPVEISLTGPLLRPVVVSKDGVVMTEGWVVTGGEVSLLTSVAGGPVAVVKASLVVSGAVVVGGDCVDVPTMNE